MKRLKIKEDWEYYTYEVDGVEINPYDITTVNVRGIEYNVKHKDESVMVNDMGHDCQVNRTVLYIKHNLGEIILRPDIIMYVN